MLKERKKEILKKIKYIQNNSNKYKNSNFIIEWLIALYFNL